MEVNGWDTQLLERTELFQECLMGMRDQDDAACQGLKRRKMYIRAMRDVRMAIGTYLPVPLCTKGESELSRLPKKGSLL